MADWTVRLLRDGFYISDRLSEGTAHLESHERGR